MATTSLWHVKSNMAYVIDYAGNPEKTSVVNLVDYAIQPNKTEQHLYVSGINCTSTCASKEMLQTKKNWNKQDGRLCYHGYQSFRPGEVDAETAHAIGVDLARQMWGGKFEVLVATHVDREHIHNHFVINSVSFVDGSKYDRTQAEYKKMRMRSDQLCREYRLSEVKQGAQETKREALRTLVDYAIHESRTVEEFFSYLRSEGYTVKTSGKYFAVTPAGASRNIRLYSLGAAYSNQAIRERIEGAYKVRGDVNGKHIRTKNFVMYHTPYRRKEVQRWYQFRLIKIGRAYYQMSDKNREAHRRMSAYSQKVRWLWKNDLKSVQDLTQFIERTDKKIQELTKVRKPLYRIWQNGMDRQAAKNAIDQLTYQIQDLRFDYKQAKLVINDYVSFQDNRLRRTKEGIVEDEPYEKTSVTNYENEH